MLLGITEKSQENNKFKIQKKIRVVTWFFVIFMILPFAILLILSLILKSEGKFYSPYIQEPVAKVITNEGIGTAFLISPNVLLTARHVVKEYKMGEDVEVIFEKSSEKLHTYAKLLYKPEISIDENDDGTVPMEYFLTDVAVLYVDEIYDIEPLQLGESNLVNNLDEVILIGYPNGDYSITSGNINSDTFRGYNLFKLDAASNPGNSGGPCILAEDNSVIGILVGGTNFMQGENIALKIDDVKLLLDNIGIPY